MSVLDCSHYVLPMGINHQSWTFTAPPHWQRRRLRNLCKVNPSATTKLRTMAGSTEVSFLPMELARAGSPKLAPRTAILSDVRNGFTPFRNGDLLIAKITPCFENGKGGIADNLLNGIGFGSTEFHVLRPGPEMDVRFLYYATMSEPFREIGVRMMRGSAGQQRIPVEFLNDFVMVFPDIRTQKLIAQFLDRHMRLTGSLIRAKRRQIELLTEQKQSIINKAVTREMGSVVWLKQSGVEWLGEMPSEWRLVRLKTIGRIRYGLSQPPKESSTGIPFVRATNIKRGKIVDKGMLYVSPEDLPQGRDPILKRHEIIVVRSGAYTADSAIVPDAYAGAIAGYDMVVSVRNANPRFVALALLSNYVLNDQLALVRTRAAQPHLNAEDLGDTLIMLPPEGEQELIADAVQLKINGLDQIITATLHQIACLREYRTRLIADVVTGKLDVRGVELPDLEGIDVADDFGGSDFDSDADQDDLPDAQEVEADGED